MRIFKKVMFYVLALLPIAYIIVSCLTGIFNDVSFASFDVGTVDIVNGSLIIEESTLSYSILEPLGLDDLGSVGLVPSLLNFLEFLKINAGVPINMPFVLAVFYYVYMFCLLLLDLVYTVLTFVIIKCREVLEK